MIQFLEVKMVRKFWIALFVVCFTLCLSQLVFAAENNPMPDTRDLVKIREGVYEYVAPDGSIQKTYIGIAGIQDRLAGLRRQLDVMTNADGPFGVDQLKKMALLSKEIRVLESIVEASLAGEVSDDLYSKILSDCDESDSEPLTGMEPSGGVTEYWATAEFTGVGSCTAYGAVFAYYYDDVVGTLTNSDNSGGYVSSMDIEAHEYGGHASGWCGYSSSVLYFNLGGYATVDPVESPEDCYCPECS